jgi:hypothetical protein
MLGTTRSKPGPGTAASTARWPKRLLVTGGLLSALNGTAHFVLPLLYPWEQHVAGLYEPVRWALFATTAFFALLLLLAGLLTVAVALASDVPPRFARWVAGGMGAFWALGAAYEVAVPFPDPFAGWALPAFSLVVAGLHLAAAWLLRPREVVGR